MRLIYIANIRFPTEKAHGIQIMSMCEAFAKNGAEVELVISRRSKIKEDPFSYYGIKPIFKITRLKTFDLTPYGKVLRAFPYHIQRLHFIKKVLAYAKKNPADIYYFS